MEGEKRKDRNLGDKNKRSSLGRYLDARKNRRQMNTFSKIGGLISTLIIIGIVILLMSGLVNQKKTTISAVNWVISVGGKVVDFGEGLFNGKGPIVWKDGFYFNWSKKNGIDAGEYLPDIDTEQETPEMDDNIFDEINEFINGEDKNDDEDK